MEKTIIESCDSCGTENVLGAEYDRGVTDEKDMLCFVCAETFCGTAYQYPNQYDSDLYKTLAQLTHIIIREIKKP